MWRSLATVIVLLGCIFLLDSGVTEYSRQVTHFVDGFAVSRITSISRRSLSSHSVFRSNDTPDRAVSRTWTLPNRGGNDVSATRRRNNSTPARMPAPQRHTTQQANNNSFGRKLKQRPMPVTGYDAKAILEYYDRRPLAVGWRLNILGFPLLGWYLRLLIDRHVFRCDTEERVQKQRGSELRHHLVASRSVALIKSGQALSLRPDLVKNKYWCEELGKLVDAVGGFSDFDAMQILQEELAELKPRIIRAEKERSSSKSSSWIDPQSPSTRSNNRSPPKKNRLQKLVDSNPVLRLFEFANDGRAVASASIGQVYKARIRPGFALEAALGMEQASHWGGRTVAIKIQRPDAEAAASLDMYLLRRTAMWLSHFRGGDLPTIADAFGMQLFGELDYVREANNCDRFFELYGDWEDIVIPEACSALTRRRVLVLSWVDGEKGPWKGQDGLGMVGIGLRCSVDQLMNTGLFHADPHRGNLLKTAGGKLALIDFGMVADIDEEFRYSLFGLVIGLQNKDLPLITENLLQLGFLKDTTQLDVLIPRLRQAMDNATGGTGKASDVNFARLQAELDDISRENILRFSTPAFFTVIIRSLTILEGIAQSVDKNFRLVRGAYPYVLKQLLNPEYNDRQPEALQKLLVRLLTVNGSGEEIEWERLRDLLRLAQKASKAYNPSTRDDGEEDKKTASRKTVELFGKFLTSRAGIFLKKPLVHELAEAIDGMASIGEANLQQFSRGLVPLLPGMHGPVNGRRMDELRTLLETFRDALIDQQDKNNSSRVEAIIDLFREASLFLSNPRLRSNAEPLLVELQSVAQMVAVEVLEIRGSRAMRSILQV